jgi:hypothetical protein
VTNLVDCKCKLFEDRFEGNIWTEDKVSKIVVIEKLMVAQLLQTFSELDGTPKMITAFALFHRWVIS